MDVRNSIDGSLQISNEKLMAWLMFLPAACRACAGC